MLKEENQIYWTNRAPGYSEVNQVELNTPQREIWEETLLEQLQRAFPGRAMEELNVLDVGTGPGFFAIILTELGCRVTAVDYTPAMLAEARRNAGALAERIRFAEMDAAHLLFDAGSFDAIFTRNLTWNLPEPEAAYAEWLRVLKPGGLLVNFDANWYTHLYNPSARAAYDADRRHTELAQIKDEYACTDIDAMEGIARRVPLSRILRPEWDLNCLRSLGAVDPVADGHIWERVWSREEKINFRATPMFMVSARKR